MINLISVNLNNIHNMIVVGTMISALECNMVCYFNSFQYKGTWFSRRASVASEKKMLGFPGILANVQRKIGAPYRDITQIGWQVCYYIACPPMPPPWRRPCLSNLAILFELAINILILLVNSSWFLLNFSI